MAEEEGPFFQTVKSFGRTAGFAVGAFGELSGEWSAMATAVARARARVVQAQTGIARSETELTGRLKREIVCHWGSQAAHGNVLVRLQIARERASLSVARKKRRADRRADLVPDFFVWCLVVRKRAAPRGSRRGPSHPPHRTMVVA